MRCSIEPQSRVPQHCPMLPAKSMSKLLLECCTLPPIFSISEKSVVFLIAVYIDGEQVFQNCGHGTATYVVRPKPG